MFAEKFSFENIKHRTADFNLTFSRIYLINRNLESKKKGQKTFKNLLSHEGSTVSLNVNHFIEQLIDIGDFAKIIDE